MTYFDLDIRKTCQACLLSRRSAQEFCQFCSNPEFNCKIHKCINISVLKCCIEETVEKFEKHLHPKHFLFVEAKSVMTIHYGVTFTKFGSKVTDMKNISIAKLKKAEVMCKEAMSSLEEIGPLTDHLAQRFGQCLLQATRIDIELLKRKFESKKMTKEEAASCVVDCRAKLRRLLEVARIKTSSVINKADFVEQAAFDDRGLLDWAKRKHLFPTLPTK